MELEPDRGTRMKRNGVGNKTSVVRPRAHPGATGERLNYTVEADVSPHRSAYLRRQTIQPTLSTARREEYEKALTRHPIPLK